MKNNFFEILFDEKSGGVCKIARSDDKDSANFVRDGEPLGVFSVESDREYHFYKFMQEKRVFELTGFYEKENSAIATYLTNGIQIETQYTLLGDKFTVKSIITNKNACPVYFNEGSITLSMPINDRYDSSEICAHGRMNAHIFAGLNSAYINAERMALSDKHLGVVFTEGSIASYSQLGVKSNDRGILLLNLSSFHLNPEEKYTLSYEIFPHEGKDSFKKRLKEYSSYLSVEASSLTVKKGDTVDFCVVGKNKVERFSAESLTANVAARAEGNRLYLSFTAENFGENKIFFTVNGVKSYALFNVTLDSYSLAEKRISFIVNNQQCMDEASPLYGAYLVYDNDTDEQYFDFRWRDHNACRERMGMGILIAKYLQKTNNPRFKESLDLFVEFMIRECVDEETGYVSDGIGKSHEDFRLYNVLWPTLFFNELYILTKNTRYLDLVEKTANFYYEMDGEKFYPNAVRPYEFIKSLENGGRAEAAKKLSEKFIRHVENIIEKGVIYPAHEVNFEQTIVTPAVSLILDCYALTGEERYLDSARDHIDTLLRFEGSAPDARIDKIPIRYWDGFWFGKSRAFGDILPHYWSSLSGYCNYLYGVLTNDEKSKLHGRATVQNCTLLFNEDGRASCAHVYPFSVNGLRGDFYDSYANDQDFALYFLLEIEQ